MLVLKLGLRVDLRLGLGLGLGLGLRCKRINPQVGLGINPSKTTKNPNNNLGAKVQSEKQNVELYLVHACVVYKGSDTFRVRVRVKSSIRFR